MLHTHEICVTTLIYYYIHMEMLLLILLSISFFTNLLLSSAIKIRCNDRDKLLSRLKDKDYIIMKIWIENVELKESFKDEVNNSLKLNRKINRLNTKIDKLTHK